jgi:hypothetical protein
VTVIPQLEICGQWGLEISGKLGVNGHNIAPLRQLNEGF